MMICRKCGREVPEGPYCLQCGAPQTPPPRAPRRRGNGTGSAYKRGATWTAQVTLYIEATETDGRKKLIQHYRTKGGFKTKREALEYIPVLQGPAQRQVPTLVELWTVYEANELRKLSKDKQTAYRKARERLEPIIGAKIDALTTAQLQAVVNERSSSYYTARDMKVLLSHLYRRAQADQFVAQNLSKFIVLPDLDESEAQPFTEAEVRALWAAFAGGETFAGYLLLMIYSGMMPGELFACRKDQIVWDRCEIYGCGKKTKVRKETPIVFAEAVRPVLVELCELHDGPKLVRMARDRWYDAYHETLRRIGIRDLPPYSCRHTTGTEAARQQLPASTIQQIMRHSKITTSQRYIHLGSQEAHAGVNAIPTTVPAPSGSEGRDL